MPTFEQATIVEHEVTPQEFLEECTDSEIEELVDLLKLDYPEFLDRNFLERRSVGEQEFEAMVNSLHGKWNMLSSEEEETIRAVAKKFL